MIRSLARLLGEDVRTVLERDPSAQGVWEALTHPGLLAVWAHRLAHRLHRRGNRLAARVVATVSRTVSGADIHPGAVLGRRVFMDHPAAVVIGETAHIGDDATIYQQVTLGAIGWWQDNVRPSGTRRHPVVGAGVVLGAGATVLGPVTIGARCVIGAGALVIKDLPPATRALAPLATVVGTEPCFEQVLESLRFTATAGSW
ncbi:MAG TPA: serine O-acetyltransferase EpsC [Acidimicrobiales bacterium]|nr:serine O-acetyltransferase EpsC [Acidimicrobiales bacterium]